MCIRDRRSEDSDMISAAFEMLDTSKLPEESKREFLIRASGYETEEASESALDRLDKDKEAVLGQIIETIEADPSGKHLDSIRLIEHWGEDAKAVVPALVKHFEARYRNRRDLRFLHLVYAVSAIGPAAKDAVAIPLAAMELRSGHRSVETSHQLAGVLCLQRIKTVDGERSGSSKKKKNSRKNRADKALLQGLLGSGGGAMIGNVPIEGLQMGSSDLSVRAIVEEHLSQLDGAEERDAAERQSNQRKVDLVFQNYDIFTDPKADGSNDPTLSIAELRKVEPPLLMREVDTDGDQQITRAELMTYFSSHSSRNANRDETQRQRLVEALMQMNGSSRNSRSRARGRNSR